MSTKPVDETEDLDKGEQSTQYLLKNEQFPLQVRSPNDLGNKSPSDLSLNSDEEQSPLKRSNRGSLHRASSTASDSSKKNRKYNPY